MVIFTALVWKNPFCVNLIQKFKRAILRRNLVYSLEYLIDFPPTKKSTKSSTKHCNFKKVELVETSFSKGALLDMRDAS